MKTKYYEITFIYADNDQQFGTGARMTERERDLMETFLDEQKDAGNVLDPQIFEPKQVEQRYHGALAEIKAALKS